MKNVQTAACAALVAVASLGAAQNYYSVDTVNDVLYRINPLTGAAAAVGPLGVDVDNVDLTWHNGALYAKSQSTVNGTRIYQLVTTGAWAGFAIPGGALNGGGYLGAEAAGLAGAGANLFATYSNQPPTNFYSGSFATVNPVTGALGSPSFLTTDADGLCFDSGFFWSMDVINPSLGCDLYRGAAVPTTYIGTMSYDNTLATNPVDMVGLNPTSLIAVGQTGRNLVRIFRATGARGIVTPITGIPNNAFMKGLAVEPGCVTVWWLWNRLD
ncbi:MAG: hypothetical protein KF733_03545 [Fimbriimonadaceae bacterium]|nr:MAG: hypothetical protein KF733_03545 [Fimbriimonadaceae bacterium]